MGVVKFRFCSTIKNPPSQNPGSAPVPTSLPQEQAAQTCMVSEVRIQVFSMVS